MRVDVPSLAVSQDGSQVAIAAGRRTTLVDVGSGTSSEVEAATTASIVALAPSGGHTPAVAAGDQLSWLVDDGDAHVTTLAGSAVFARLADDGSVVVVTRSDATGGFVVVVEGDSFAPIVNPVPLGHASVFVVERDSASSVILAGRRGDRRAWEGSGEQYVCRVNWAGGTAAIDWNGEGLDGAAGPMRASSGWLAAVRGTRLVWAHVDSLRDGVEPAGVELGGTVSSLALSPAGDRLVFVGEDDHVHTRERGGGDPTDRGSVGGVSAIELAVDDDGSVTVVGRRSATEVVVLSAPASGELSEATSLDVPRSVFRNKD